MNWYQRVFWLFVGISIVEIMQHAIKHWWNSRKQPRSARARRGK